MGIDFDPDQYRESVTDYERTWRVLDDVLYRLCRDHPGHADWAGVCAKLWIIARSYSTQIERHVISKGTQGSSLTQVAEHLFAHANEIDALITELKAIQDPLDPTKLRSLTSIHGRFVTLLSPITRSNLSTRSFASKYLHFHHPMMPIYDGIAAERLPKFGRWKKSMHCFSIPTDADETYSWYVMRLYAVHQRIVAAGLPNTVKYLDNYVLGVVMPTPLLPEVMA